VLKDSPVDEVVHVPEFSPTVPDAEVILPPGQVSVEVLYQLLGRLKALLWAGQLSDFVPLLCHRLGRGKKVQEAPGSTLQVFLKSETVPQKIQGLTFLFELDRAGLFAVYHQAQPAFQTMFYPPFELDPLIPCHDHEVSRAEESHPCALSELDVNLSAHPAPVTEPSL
jgi:hypothetical protein